MTGSLSTGASSPGTLVTFYSYKGGVGRSMALANVAALLSRWGRRVLVVDWDLEAPGIEKYFQTWLDFPAGRTPGIVELIQAQTGTESLDWRDCRLTASIPKGQSIDIIPAGRDDGSYSERLRRLDWGEMFRSNRLGNYLESLRQEWKTGYDFILLDSRTGVTDIGGICSIHLPDILVAMFVANEQSLMGMKPVLESAREGHDRLPVDRRRLIIVPVPSRDESGSEYKLAEQWRARFAKELEGFLADWIPVDETESRVMDYLKIPYFPYWSFGERIPVLEQEDPDNPKTLAYAYQPLAKLLFSGMNWREARAGSATTEEAQRLALEVEHTRMVTTQLVGRAKREAEERRAREIDRQAFEREKRTAEYRANVVQRIEHWRKKAREFDRRNLLGMGTAGVTGAILAGSVLWMVSTRVAPLNLSIMAATAGVFLVLSSVYLVLRPRTLARVARATADLLERELRVFESKGLPYGRMNPDEALERFIETAERTLKETAAMIAENPRASVPSVAGINGDDATPATTLSASPETSAADQTAKSASISNQFASVWKLPALENVPAEFSASEEHSIPSPQPLPPKQKSIGWLPSFGSQAKDPREATLSGPAWTAPVRVYEVFVSYRQSPLLDEWIREFLPLFTSWLAEELGRDAAVYAGPSGDPAGRDALNSAKCMVIIWTPAYFHSSSYANEWLTYLGRGGRIVPVLFHGEPGQLPPEARTFRSADFRRFAYTGEAFRSTEAYIDYQKAIRMLAADVAGIVSSQGRAAGTGLAT